MLTEEEIKYLIEIVHASNVSTLDMYKDLAKEPGNFVFSLVSIDLIIALTYEGAGGNTATQIDKWLHLPNDRAVVAHVYGAIMTILKMTMGARKALGVTYVTSGLSRYEPSIRGTTERAVVLSQRFRSLLGERLAVTSEAVGTDSDGVLLDIENRIFVKAGFVIEEEYEKAAARFKAEVEEVDFLQEAQAGKTINEWVENITDNKMKDIIAPGDLDDQTRMVLVNAIYMEGKWMQKFNENQTTPLPFHSASGAEENVDMMCIMEKFKYTESDELNSQVLLLSYERKEFSMMIILPSEVNGLPSLEEKLYNFNPHDTVNEMHEQVVHVYLPKFEAEYSRDLTETLKKSGITDMFDDKVSDFTGISDVRLKVDTALHNAFVEVNEEGSEAAASTHQTSAVAKKAVRPDGRSSHLGMTDMFDNNASDFTGISDVRLKVDKEERNAFVVVNEEGSEAAASSSVISFVSYRGDEPPPPVIFKADHPFMFIILDHRLECMLFAGRFSDPTSTP